MFGSRYREAYDAIVPPQELVEGMVAWAEKNDGRKKGIKTGLCKRRRSQRRWQLCAL